jgi:hypothetical protein
MGVGAQLTGGPAAHSFPESCSAQRGEVRWLAAKETALKSHALSGTLVA